MKKYLKAMLVLSLCSFGSLMAHSYDYIIIGGGAAGCIEARKLSDNKHKSVLLIEAGGNYIDDPVTLDPNWVDNANTLLINPKYSITYPSIVGFLQAIVYSEGHELGGGAAHNYMLTYRGTPSIYNLWETITGNSLWSYYGNILSIMLSLETYTPNGTTANPAERGTDGPISVLQSPPLASTPGTFLSELSSYTDTPFINDYNDPSLGDIGISAVQQFITANGSRRSFSAYDYLKDVIDENGYGLNGRKLRVLTNAQVLKFKINRKMRAKSVHYVYTNKCDKQKIEKVKLKKNKGVLILAAGSIQTPNLLLHSGVGPAAQLEAAGIPCIVNSPNVGQNLQCQYGTAAIVSGGTIAFEAEMLLDGYPYMPNDGVRRLQIIGIPLGNNLFELLPTVTNPNSRGSVTVVNNNPLISPLVNIGIFTDGSYSTEGTDAYLQLAFFKIIQHAANSAGETVVFPTPVDYSSDANLFSAALDLTYLTVQSHACGTARMGSNISNGVVDGNLNVFGLENVKIGDASVMPQTTNGNICYAAYVIGLVLCQILGAQ